MRAALLALLLPLTAAAEQAWSPPDSLAAKVEALTPAARAFVTSGAFRRYLPERQLEHELNTRSDAELQTFLADLMNVASAMGYDPSRNMGAMPLNLTTKEFHAGMVVTPKPLRKIERADGPFSVHRYLFPESGVPTFAGADVAIWPEDLLAGAVDVAIVGIPNDMSSGTRNAEYGPRAMRALNTMGLPDDQSLVDPLATLKVVDYGDFAVDNMSTERTVGHVTAMVRETAATGAVPFMVGGDTSMLYPGVKGVAEAASEPFGLLHFSAHPDVDTDAVHTISDTQAVFLLLREGLVEGRDLVQVGARGAAVTADSLQWLRDQKARYHTMAELERRGSEAVLKKVRREVARGPARFFVSVDVSVVEPAEMIAAGRVVAGGIPMAALTATIREVCASKEIVGFEITDMAPMLDLSRLSALNANAIVNACLVGMAVRRAGFAPDYIHPLAAGHGQR
ncbi:MAG: arginase family protein [Pseudomonadota bacterium]